MGTVWTNHPPEPELHPVLIKEKAERIIGDPETEFLKILQDVEYTNSFVKV